jgi:hypothetical protein
MLGPDASLRTRQKEPLKTTMAKTGDHPGSVTPQVTMSRLLTLALSGRAPAVNARRGRTMSRALAARRDDAGTARSNA